jgi:hypothetical protein
MIPALPIAPRCKSRRVVSTTFCFQCRRYPKIISVAEAGSE